MNTDELMKLIDKQLEDPITKLLSPVNIYSDGKKGIELSFGMVRMWHNKSDGTREYGFSMTRDEFAEIAKTI